MLNAPGKLAADWESDEGAENWPCTASLIECCKLNDVNPHAWMPTL